MDTQITSNKFWEALRLMRLDRPVGTFLCLWPVLTALWLAAKGAPHFNIVLIFMLGALFMRAAGCIINDIADVEFDKKVARTKSRPLAAGTLSKQFAWNCCAALCALSLLLVLQLNLPTIILAFVGAALAALYPLSKRVTHLPQVVLGFAFNWGILMAFTAVTGSVSKEAILLFFAMILWTIAYDTLYAMVDRQDDIKAGVKSTALLFGKNDLTAVATLFVLSMICLIILGLNFGMGLFYWLGLLAASGVLVYECWIAANRSPKNCLHAFCLNHWVGLSLFLGVFLNY